MSVERIAITDRAQWLALREKDITASVIGALLGCHEYETAYQLWSLKSGLMEPDREQTEAMERGELLEPVAAELLRRRNPTWKITYPVGVYYRDPDARMGCTPDIQAVDPDQDDFANVQVKSVEASVFRRKWVDPETKEITPPLWIAVQSMIEAHLTGATRAYVTPLVVGHGLDMPLVEIPIHTGLVDRLKREVAAFWRMVETQQPPDPDYARDGAAIERVFAASGAIIDAAEDNMLPVLLDERAGLAAAKTEAEKRLKAIKAELVFKIGSNDGVRLADGRVVTAKRVHRKSYSVEASSYVDVRVKPSVQEKDAA